MPEVSSSTSQVDTQPVNPPAQPAVTPKKFNRKLLLLGCLSLFLVVICCCILLTVRLVSDPKFMETLEAELADENPQQNDGDSLDYQQTSETSSSQYSFSSSTSSTNTTTLSLDNITYDNFKEYDFDVIFDAGPRNSFAFNMPASATSHRVETNTGCVSVALKDGIRVYLGMANSESIDCITRGYYDKQEAICADDGGVQNSEPNTSDVKVNIGSDYYNMRVWEFSCKNGEKVISQTYTYVQTDQKNDLGSFSFMVSSQSDRIGSSEFKANQSTIVNLVESVAVF